MDCFVCFAMGGCKVVVIVSDTVTPVVGQSKTPHAPSLTQSLNDPGRTLFNPLLMSDSEALIKVELEVISPICPTNTNEGETLHIANVQINNLDVIGRCRMT